MLQMEQKMFHGEQKNVLMGKVLSSVAHWTAALHCMTLPWSCVALHGFLWSFMVLCSYVVVWFYIAFSRGHRSRFIWFYCCCFSYSCFCSCCWRGNMTKKCSFMILDKLRLIKALSMWASVTFCDKHFGIVWPYVVFCGRVCVALWSCMCRLVVLYGLFMVLYGIFIGLVSSFLAIIDPNSFGLD